MIEVIRLGQFTTIQDLGRFGYRSMGVPVSGPMDQESATHSNHLLGNDANDALIEMAYVGATFLFHKTATIAFAGARSEVKLNDEVIDDRSILIIEAGSTLSFGVMKEGNFLYLAIRGGFQTKKTLGSTCYYPSVNGMSRMNKGTQLLFDETVQNSQIEASNERWILKPSSSLIEVEKGPEFHLLSNDDILLLTETRFTISPQSNRMGFRLNEHVNIVLKETISSPVQPGTVQLTKGGQLLVLMKDAQTVGGYPRVLQLTDKSIIQMAQTTRNQTFRFKLRED